MLRNYIEDGTSNIDLISRKCIILPFDNSGEKLLCIPMLNEHIVANRKLI